MSSQLTTTARGFMPAMPTTSEQDVLANLEAIEGGGGGGGGLFLSINRTTGELTFGNERTPLPADRCRFVVPRDSILHGYIVHENNKPRNRVLVPMVRQSVPPNPPGGFAEYPNDGARTAKELTLFSVDEPGFALTFTSWAVSHDDQIDRLRQNIITQMKTTKEGTEGFVNPIIRLKAGFYTNKHGTIYHFDYDILGWLHLDGRQVYWTSDGPPPVLKEAQVQDDGEEADWDDGEDDEEMTEEDRELLRA